MTHHWTQKVALVSTIDCRYIAVKCNTIGHTAQQLQSQNFCQILRSWALPLWTIFHELFIDNDRDISTAHCNYWKLSNGYVDTWHLISRVFMLPTINNDWIDIMTTPSFQSNSRELRNEVRRTVPCIWLKVKLFQKCIGRVVTWFFWNVPFADWNRTVEAGKTSWEKERGPGPSLDSDASSPGSWSISLGRSGLGPNWIDQF